MINIEIGDYIKGFTKTETGTSSIKGIVYKIAKTSKGIGYRITTQDDVKETIYESLGDINIIKKVESVIYPEYIVKILRERRDLDENDSTEDKQINLYSSNEAFSEVLDWEGIIGYQSKIKKWIKDIYGVDLHELGNK